MPDSTNYYIITKKAMPDVYLKVVLAKKLIEKEKAITVQEAVDTVGISRSSFYKYKDDIFPFYEGARGSVITIGMGIDDEPGLLSGVLNMIAAYKANILTIHQTIPINGVANITLSIEVLPTTGDINTMISDIEDNHGIHQIKILGRE